MPVTAAMCAEGNGMVVRFTGLNLQIVSGSGATDVAVNGPRQPDRRVQ